MDDHLHYGSLGVARTLGRLGVRVYVLDDHPRPIAASSRFVAETVALDPDAPGEVAVDALLGLADRLGERPVLIPLDDVGALLVDANADELERAFRFERQPPGLVESLLDKWKMTQLARRHGVGVPETLQADSDDEAAALLADLDYPLVLKGAGSYVPGTNVRAALEIVASREEAERAYERMSPAERRNVMFQEYVPGGPETVWMFNGYFDERSDCRIGFTGRKLRQWPPATGATSLGVTVSNDVVAETTQRFMKEIGYRGALDLGYRYDRRDDTYKLLDVNPRVGATFRLFVDPGSGLDVVRALYLDAIGEPLPPVAARSDGRKWIVEDRDFRSIVATRGGGSMRDWTRSLRGIDEAAWFSRDDPAPFAAMTARRARALLVRRRRSADGA